MRRCVLLTGAVLVLAAGPAEAAPVSQDVRVELSDGVELQATITGEGPLSARPVIVEFSPYGNGSGTFNAGPAYNHLLVQIRGTGSSDGRFDALGPRTQADVAEMLDWACDQSWSDGRLGINGFSASAITIYNSLHQELPCVKAAVLKSGTFELYRDLIWPGGISNLVPGFGVMALIGAPALAQSFERAARDPLSGFDVLAGLLAAGLDGLSHSTLDQFWRERGFRGDVNDLPILMVNGFFDVESRGAFQGYQELRGDGAHLTVIGAHDRPAGGTDSGTGKMKAWFDRYVLDLENGVEDTPRVQLWLADGDREDLGDGKYVTYQAEDWPVPGTRWESLNLDPAPSGTARSLNDGTLSTEAPAGEAGQSYPSLQSNPFSTDLANAGIVGGAGFDGVTTPLPLFTDMTTAEPLGLSYTTTPFATDVLAAGPASLEVQLSQTAPQTGIWAVISDVWPDGTPHPVAAGRLNSDFPGVDEAKSFEDPATGDIVQPYGTYDNRQPATIGQERLYRVELWPIGNRFKAGHRLRLHIVGTSLASLPGPPGVNTVRVGGDSGSRLLVPMLPGSDIGGALSACANLVRGTRRADRLRGTSAGDRLLGRDGADRLRGRDGDDCLIGGHGRDRHSGGPGDDLIRARGRARDVVRCGPGDDTAFADGRDVVRGCETVRGGARGAG